MELLLSSFIGALFSVAVFFSILYLFVRAVMKTALGPIHEKLDRLLVLYEKAARS